MVEQLVQDACLLEFYEEITNSALFLGSSEKVSIKKYFLEHSHELDSLQLSDLSSYFTYYKHIINEIFLLEPKVSICGFSVVEEVQGYNINTFDFYFESCEKQHIENVIKSYLTGSHRCIISRDEEQVMMVCHEHYNINFHLKSSLDKGQMLQNVKSEKELRKSCKFGFNQKSGYFCSIVAILETYLELCSEGGVITGEYYFREKQNFDIKEFLYNRFILINECKRFVNLDIFRLIFSNWILVQVLSSRQRIVN